MTYQEAVRPAGSKRLLGAFMSPSNYDFWSHQLGSTRAWSRCFARVVGRVDEAPGSITLKLTPNSNFAGFMPGQHVNLSAQIDGRRVTRSYSFSNIPNKAGEVEITIRRDPDGLMSNWLFSHAYAGTVLELDQVFGKMTSGVLRDKPLVLLAAGSGISPIMSLLREQAAKGMPREVTLVYWERHRESLCFLEEIQSIARQSSCFQVHTVITSEQGGERVSSEQLKRLNVEVKDVQVLACGGHDFVERSRHCAESAGSEFMAEAFTPPQRITDVEVEQHHVVELLGSGRRVEVSNQQSLLEALEAHGVAIESGCRMGVCNTCSCSKVSGSTGHTSSNAIDSRTHSPVRLCVSRAASNLQLAL